MFFDMSAQCLPPGYDRCLLPLARGGSSLIEYREFDDVTGHFVKGGFATPPIRDDIAWLNENEVIVGDTLDGSPNLISGFARVIRLWRRGTPLSSASPIFRAGASDSFTSVTGLGVGPDRRVVITDGVDYGHFGLYSVDQRGLLRKIDLPARLAGIGTPVTSGHDVIVQLAVGSKIADRAYPPEALIAYDLDRDGPGARVSQVYVPPVGAYVNDPFMGLAGTRTAVAFVQSVHLRKTLYFAQQTGGHWTVQKSVSAAAGVAMHIVAANEDGESVLVSEEGFLQPKRVLWVRPGSAPREIAAEQPVIDSSRYRVEIHTAISRDGTPIDYYLLRPKTLAKGPVPTIITGYGAYGVNDDPTYFGDGLGRSLVPWLEHGGAYVIAGIRGGGERGAAWHEAAMGIHKQRSFDDFIAVAEALVRSGFTAPCALGNYGRSAGGLLVAAVDVERPQLFAASLVGVPIVDILRLSGGAGISGGMSAEFGSPSTIRGYEALLAYSPYENIQRGVKYPNMLVVSATDDTQVGPGQARKFVAKLEYAGAHPLLIEGTRGGHGYPNQYEHPKVFATQITFFMHYLMTPGCTAQRAAGHAGGRQ
jgi:prolyl oligopeptidase